MHKCSFPGVSSWTSYFYVLKTTWFTPVSSLYSPALVSTLTGWDRLLVGAKHCREELKKLLNKHTFPFVYCVCISNFYCICISFPSFKNNENKRTNKTNSLFFSCKGS